MNIATKAIERCIDSSYSLRTDTWNIEAELEDLSVIRKPSKQPSAPADQSYDQELVEFMMHLEFPGQPLPENPFEPKVRKLEDYFEDPAKRNETATFGHRFPANSSADTNFDLKGSSEMSFAEYLRTIDRDASLK